MTYREPRTEPQGEMEMYNYSTPPFVSVVPLVMFDVCYRTKR